MQVTKEQAIEEGLTRYFTGKPCKRGHIAERSTNDSTCVQCIAEVYRSKKPKKLRKIMTEANKKQKHREYYQANKEHWKKVSNDRYHNLSEEDKKIHIARAKDNYKKHEHKYKGKQQAYIAEYRVRRKRQTPQWADQEAINKIYQRCYELNQMWDTRLTVDHIIPLNGKKVCGLHCEANLQLLDHQLNCSKSNKLDV